MIMYCMKFCDLLGKFDSKLQEQYVDNSTQKLVVLKAQNHNILPKKSFYSGKSRQV